MTRARTIDNEGALAAAFLTNVVARYEGTRLGRQELDGELIEDRADALWQRDMLEACRVAAAPELERIVVAVDPPAASGARSDACGIVAAGIDADGQGLRAGGRHHPGADAGALGAAGGRPLPPARGRPHRGGGEPGRRHGGGGDPPAGRERGARQGQGNRGKLLRAEPVAALYEKGEVKHVGAFPELEDEMCDFGLGGLSSGRSPDRLDALVWALSALMLKRDGKPRVRGLVAVDAGTEKGPRGGCRRPKSREETPSERAPPEISVHCAATRAGRGKKSPLLHKCWARDI